jgi:hypothetical protein
MLARGRARLVLALTGATLAVTLAACGSKPPNGAEFHARAKAICIAERLRSRQIARPLTPGDIQSFVSDALGLLRPTSDKLGALQPPDQLRGDFETALGSLRRRVSMLEDVQKKLRDRAEPLSTFAAVTPKLRALKRDEAPHWQAIGLPDCAST